MKGETAEGEKLPELFCLVRQIRSAGLSQDFVKRYRGSRVILLICVTIAVGSLMQSDPIFNLKAKGEKRK